MMVCFGANHSGLDMGFIYWGGIMVVVLLSLV
jgi:hypothetical protein